MVASPDTATTTTGAETTEAAGAPTSEEAGAPADPPALQGEDADTRSTVAADDSSPAEPAPDLEAASDNQPFEELAATGTE